jgi:hypothetical protein
MWGCVKAGGEVVNTLTLARQADGWRVALYQKPRPR